MKKMFLISLAALACISTACSDDDDNRCTAGFTKCDKDILLTCSADNRIQKTQCPTTCSEIAGVAACDSLPGQGCGDIDDIGKCVGNVVYFCENDQVQSQDCGNDKVCGLNSKNLYDCVDKQVGPGPGPGPHEGCGEVDDKGKCDGNKALVCVNGELKSKECAANETCGVREDGQVDCLNKGNNPENPCGDIDGYGKCENNVITYCAEGPKLETLECTENEICDVDQDNYYQCVKKVTEISKKCGEVDKVGKCEGQDVVYCSDDNKLVSMTCNDDEECALDANGFYNCVEKGSQPEPQQGCGNIDIYGTCKNNDVVYCNVDKLETIKCSANESCDTDSDGFYMCFKNMTEEQGSCDILEDDFVGKCDGQKVLFCSLDEKLMSYVCNEDEKCSFDPESGYYDCMAKVPCGKVDNVGVCKDNVVSYCEDEILKSIECEEGYVCGMNTVENYYDCLEKEDPNACGDVDAKGKCDNNKAIYCDADQLKTDECTKDQECKADKDGNFRCVDKAPEDPCKGIDAKGKCDGNKATYCDANVLKTDTCTDAQECKADDNGNFRCIDKAPEDPCKGIDAKGKCDGNKATYCDANVLKTDTCSEAQECKADDNGNFRCVDKAPADPCEGIDAKGKCDGNKAIYCDANQLKTDECSEAQECKANGDGNFRCVDKAEIDPCEKCTSSQKCEKDEHGDYQCIDPTE
ncbi:MAG: hypothetical protein J6A01_06505 [Proteobacteria bacterium]|nr:hypothetical protein [Pseudomonadota bacterium]